MLSDTDGLTATNKQVLAQGRNRVPLASSSIPSTSGLSQVLDGAEAMEKIRALVDLVLTPEDGQLRIDLTGELPPS